MKKYRVTDKHPYLKEGTIIENNIIEVKNSLSNLRFSDSEIKDISKKNWIEEIQEPEFTKDDMINFADYFDGGSPYKAHDMFNEWIKDKKG